MDRQIVAGLADTLFYLFLKVLSGVAEVIEKSSANRWAGV